MRDGGLRQLFQRHIPEAHWQAIETWSTGMGVPDLNGCLKATEFWIELKQTKANAVGISPEQVAWIERRCRAGGRVFVAVRQKCEAGKRKVACDNLLIYHGSDARKLLTDGVDGPLYEGRWVGGPAAWDWQEVRATILR